MMMMYMKIHKKCFKNWVIRSENGEKQCLYVCLWDTKTCCPDGLWGRTCCLTISTIELQTAPQPKVSLLGAAPVLEPNEVETQGPGPGASLRMSLVSTLGSWAPGRAGGSAVSPVAQLHVFLCAILLPPSSFHRCWSLLNLVHPKLPLSICFQRTRPASGGYHINKRCRKTLASSSISLQVYTFRLASNFFKKLSHWENWISPYEQMHLFAYPQYSHQ